MEYVIFSYFVMGYSIKSKIPIEVHIDSVSTPMNLLLTSSIWFLKLMNNARSQPNKAYHFLSVEKAFFAHS